MKPRKVYSLVFDYNREKVVEIEQLNSYEEDYLKSKVVKPNPKWFEKKQNVVNKHVSFCINRQLMNPMSGVVVGTECLYVIDKAYEFSSVAANMAYGISIDELREFPDFLSFSSDIIKEAYDSIEPGSLVVPDMIHSHSKGYIVEKMIERYINRTNSSNIAFTQYTVVVRNHMTDVVNTPGVKIVDFTELEDAIAEYLKSNIISWEDAVAMSNTSETYISDNEDMYGDMILSSNWKKSIEQIKMILSCRPEIYRYLNSTNRVRHEEFMRYMSRHDVAMFDTEVMTNKNRGRYLFQSIKNINCVFKGTIPPGGYSVYKALVVEWLQLADDGIFKEFVKREKLI